MAYIISRGWKAKDVYLGIYGEGGRGEYTANPVGNIIEERTLKSAKE